MSFVSYAQNFEDVMLWRALQDVRRGTYVDIGAQDPEIDSVSLAFYNAGWRGIHVEPTPHYAARLREARPDERVIQAVVTDAPGPIQFFEIPETGLSTGRKDIATRHDIAGYSHRKISTPCIRLDALLELAEGDVHWLKIDVEGMEIDVLRSWGESASRPWVLVIEATMPNTQVRSDDQWIDEVLRRDYEPVFFDGISRYFLHSSQSELASRFSAPPNIFDAFVVAPHQFAATEIKGQLDATRQRLDFEWARAEQNAAELSETRTELNHRRYGERIALEKLVATNEAHQSRIDDFLNNRRNFEQEFRAAEERLQQELTAARAELALAQIELARFQERTGGLEAELSRSDTLKDEAVKRAAKAEDEVASLRAHLDQLRQQAWQETNELRSMLDRAQRESNETSVRSDKRLAEADQRHAQQSVAIEQLQASLRRADEVIRAVVVERPGRWQRLGETLGFARRSPSLRALSGWQSNAFVESGNAYTEQIAAPTFVRPPSGNPYHRANSLSELLSWDDVDFVRCAYVTVLGRQPDPTGEKYYTDRLRRGRSKMDVLRNLRRSPEGPLHDPGIAGLDRALRADRWRRHLPFAKSAARGAHVTPTDIRTADRADRSTTSSQIEGQVGVLLQKMEEVQQSLLFVEGSVLKKPEANDAGPAPLDEGIFLRRLAIVAREFESAAG